MINVFHAGGMSFAAKDMLFQVVADYQEKSDKLFSFAIKFLIETALPKIKGRKPRPIPRDVKIMLQLEDEEITWSEWLEFFPGSSIEMMEDKQGGRTGFLTKEKLGRLRPDDFLEDKTGLFYSPNGFNDEVREGMKRKREQGNIKSLNAFFIDLDKAPTKELKDAHRRTIGEFSIAPSFVVETRNGFHVLWLLERLYGAEDSMRWKSIQKGLIAHFQADRACSDSSRLLRMPSSWHCKRLWVGGEAFKVKLVYRSKIRYTMDDFRAFESKQKPRKVFEMKEGEVVIPPNAALGKGDRHAALKEEIARAYARIGTNRELAPKVRGEMKTWYQASCIDLKPHWEKEVDDYCDWVTLNQFGNKIS